MFQVVCRRHSKLQNQTPNSKVYENKLSEINIPRLFVSSQSPEIILACHHLFCNIGVILIFLLFSFNFCVQHCSEFWKPWTFEKRKQLIFKIFFIGVLCFSSNLHLRKLNIIKKWIETNVLRSFISRSIVLIGQSAMVYCAGKPMEKSRVFWIII